MRIIFWNEDTQNDFMNADGALYVPEAESIKLNLRMLTEHAQLNDILTLCSIDAHSEKDPEMKVNGGPFPLHCLKGTRGADFITETKPLHPYFVENRPYSGEEIERMLKHPGELVFEKQSYDVFDNPNTQKILEQLRPERAVVYGVATDYCDRAAVLGLRKLGIEVYLVSDAIKPVAEETGKSALEEMCKSGARLITTKEVLEGKL